MNRPLPRRVTLALCWPIIANFTFAGAIVARAQTSPTAGLHDAMQPREALVFALNTNLGYCRDWLSAGDFKSLAQSIGALSVLTDALSRYAADVGQEKIAALRRAVDELSVAAKGADSARAKSALDALPEFITVAAAAPPAESPRAPAKTTAGFNPLMHTIDGAFADAKTALATGDVAAAKANAVVLVELAQWLAADRGGAQWKSQSADLESAAKEVASSDSTDPKIFRAQLHDVYSRCAACHQRQR